MGRRGGGTATAEDPADNVEWSVELLHKDNVKDDAAVATGSTEPTPADPAPADGDAEAATDDRPKLRGLALDADDEKPILVHFHWPHDDGARGRNIQKFCGGPLDDAIFTRLTSLFRCIEVNTKASDEDLVQEAGVVRTPTLMVLAPDGTIVWRHDGDRLSGKALGATLRKVLQQDFPARWKAIEEEMELQKRNLREAQFLVKQKKLEDASWKLNEVVASDVRFTPEYDKARELQMKVDRDLWARENDE